ncbi:MAG: hypothetical protein KGJ90_03915 [Patescibacteria group bacterium]|nr:hypothetical protein [Patescibacteria group bacterium]
MILTKLYGEPKVSIKSFRPYLYMSEDAVHAGLYGEPTDGPANVNELLGLVGKVGRLRHSKLPFKVIAVNANVSLIKLKIGNTFSDWLTEKELREAVTDEGLKDQT